MSTLLIQIDRIIRKHPKAYVSGSGKRSIEQQMTYVKERPTQYPKTLNKFFKDHRINEVKKKDKKYLQTIYQGKEAWLKKTILDFARRNVGFQHLSGNAVDVSVKQLSLQEKKDLFAELKNEGYHIILEYVAKTKSKYNVPIEQANVFHIDLIGINNQKNQERPETASIRFGTLYCLRENEDKFFT